jgi:Fe(3+) dicitrate transport protein
VDPELTDSRGYNAESGLRGQVSAFRYDVNLFLLSYKNRIGLMNNVRTNIGNSLSRGLEGLLEFEPLRLISNGETKPPSVSVFVSGAIMRAEYSAWKDKSPGKDFSGKKVEYAPDLTLRSGLQFLYRAFSFSAIWSHQSSVYSDALNTEMPSANAQLGRIPAWSVIDLSTTFAFWSGCQLKIGVNNLLDTRYATRRAGGYPGPGLLPGLARNFYGSFSVNF